MSNENRNQNQDIRNQQNKKPVQQSELKREPGKNSPATPQNSERTAPKQR